MDPLTALKKHCWCFVCYWWLIFPALLLPHVIAVGVVEAGAEELADTEPAIDQGLGDKDGDGVIDARDQCPSTDSRLTVNNQGCPEKGMKTIKETVVIPFYPDTPETNTLKISQIQQLAIFARKYPSANITLTGHSEQSGNRQKNKAQALTRARVVKEILVSRFKIKESRIKLHTVGAMQPLMTVAAELDKKKNRRVVGEAKTEIKGQIKRWDVFQ
ncbi:OmpA family protein [Endozoicomonas sp. SM1973]|uniref:OmpA family protein n=1 Tax=Spartinivicinus marinus TaxID=2994442 RepID=A0A853I5I4_9GAMM|nr:OmpA family protein [Spartinivicinus marinus]MCX4026651.1 OmpA family protein [Spartinivicinus marinus]NYZ64485.1 OmpA family protein [Spartinivicinus marinus]